MDETETWVNTLILETDNLWSLSDFIGMARYSTPVYFEVEAVWSHGIIRRKFCALLKGGDSVLKMLIECAKKRKTVRCYYSAFIKGQEWDADKKEWVKS